MIDWIALFGRIFLAAVFLVAALGKLTDRGRSPQGLMEFGIPRMLAEPMAFILPVVEIAIAALLLFTVTARVGALSALGLVGMFIVGITINLARGRRPDCHCFGQLHSAPVGLSTVLRNVFLAAVALTVAWQSGVPPHVTVGSTGLNGVAWIALVVAVFALGLAAIEGWLLVGLLQQQGRLLTRLEATEAALGLSHASGLPVGEHAPDFQLSDLAGNSATLTSLRSPGLPLVLFFTNPHCGPCDELLPKVGVWQREYRDRITIAVISRDAIALNQEKTTRHGIRSVLLQKGREVVESYRVESTPSAVLLSNLGRIASPVVYGAEQIERLVNQAARGADEAIPEGLTKDGVGHGHPASVSAPATGRQAPALALPSLDGETITLADFQGSSTLVLFWNPDCGFCQRMLPDVKAWERKRAPQSPQLLIVSSGSLEANRAMGFLSPVVRDADGTTMREFGATGTPMGVLIDEGGRVASSVAAGAEQVLALATGSPDFASALAGRQRRDLPHEEDRP